jgi:outer membrane protein OmpA-like peptidoglycan-associated protein
MMRFFPTTTFAIAAVAAAITLTPTVGTTPASAQEICNPVYYTAAPAPAVIGNGSVARHGFSHVCPPVAAAAVEAPPPAPAVAQAQQVVIAGDVAFEFDRDVIRPQFYPELNAIADRLNETPNVRVAVQGHTDSVGPAAYNQGLSERRAQSVANYLAGRGVSRDRMEVSGFGETRPIATNETREGRAQNRRVEINDL